MQPLLLITNSFLNVRWQFKFKTDCTELPATDVSNRSLSCTNNVQLQYWSHQPTFLFLRREIRLKTKFIIYGKLIICSDFLYIIPQTLTPVLAILLIGKQISTEANKQLRMMPKLFKAITVYPGSRGQRPTVLQLLCQMYFVHKFLHSSICTVNAGLCTTTAPNLLLKWA